MAEIMLENIVEDSADAWCEEHGKAMKDYSFVTVKAERVMVPIGCGDVLPIVKRRLAREAPWESEAIVHFTYIPGLMHYDAYGIALVPRESKERKSEPSESYLKMFSRSAPHNTIN